VKTAQPQDAVPDMTLREIAELQRCSTDTVRRHHATWTRDSGFPAPVLLAGVRGLRTNVPPIDDVSSKSDGPGHVIPSLASAELHSVAARQAVSPLTQTESSPCFARASGDTQRFRE